MTRASLLRASTLVLLLVITAVLLAACGSDEQEGVRLAAPAGSDPTPTVADESTPVAQADLNPAEAAELAPVAVLGRGTIYEADWSPDGSLLAIGTGRGLLLYPAAELAADPTTEPQTFETSRHVFRFSPDGSLLVTANADSQIQLWDTATGDLRYTLAAPPVEDPPANFIVSTDLPQPVFNPDQSQVAAAWDGQVMVWDLDESATGPISPQIIPAPEERIVGLDYRADGTLLFVGSTNNIPDFNQLNTGARPDYGDDFSIRVWDVAANEMEAELIELSGPALLARFTDDHTHLLVHTFGTPGTRRPDQADITYWDLASGEQVYTTHQRGHPEAETFRLAPDQTQMLAWGREFSGFGGQVAVTNEIVIWDTASGEAQGYYQFEQDDVRNTWRWRLSPDQTTLLGISSDGRINLWPVPDAPATDREPALLGEPAVTLDRFSGTIQAVDFDPEAETVGAALFSGRVLAWDITSGAEIHRLSNDEYNERRAEVGLNLAVAVNFFGAEAVVSPDGSLLVSLREQSVIVVNDIRTGETLGTLLLADPVSAVGIGSDNLTLAIADRNGKITLRNYDTRDELAAWQAHPGPLESISFSADGSQIFTLGPGRAVDPGDAEAMRDARVIRVWDVASQAQVAELVPEPGTDIERIATTPDGSRLALIDVAEPPRIQFWDIATEALTLEITLPTNGVGPVAFSDNGARVAVGGSDGLVRVWDLPAED